MTSAIERIEARQREIQAEIWRLRSLLPGLEMALEILKTQPVNADVIPSGNISSSPVSNEDEKINTPAVESDTPPAPSPWPKTLYDVPDEHLRALHARGLSDNKITQELQQQGYSCNQGNTSRKLRAMGLRANGRRVPPGEDRTASVVSTSSPEKGVDTNDALAEESPGLDVAPSEAETMKDDDWDQGPLYQKPEESSAEAVPASITPQKKRRGRPRKNSAPTDEGEYPVIGRAPSGAPQFGSMRMKVIEEKIVDGHKVKVLPPGYAQGAYPQKNVTVRS
jgi:hypothetical protein